MPMHLTLPESLEISDLSAFNAHPDLLLQLLIRIQRRYGYIPMDAVDRLAMQFNIPASRIEGVISFYSFLHLEPRGQYAILVSNSITDLMLGSRTILKQLLDTLGVEQGVTRTDGRVSVDVTSCTGLCDQGPAILVNGHAINQVDTTRAKQICELVEASIPLAQWPAAYFQIDDHIQRKDLMLGAGWLNGTALKILCDQGPEPILTELDTSGLRGRGGAGFTTALKWRLCRQSSGTDRIVVCNADEGEPGTFKDRVLLNSYADIVFEGMTLCAGVIGASRGFLYLRGEYLHLKAPLEAVLRRRREEGLLGKSILGQAGFDFDIDIHLGAGAYICGEESALIESLEGKRGIPRNRPPFPVSEGYLGLPTVVNNVETFFAAAHIATRGGQWFGETGTPTSRGTRLLSVSGDCERPGIYEYPWGTTIAQILEDCGASAVQAVQIAGAAGATVPPSEFHRVISFDDLPTGGSFIVFDQRRKLIDMVQNFAHFFVHESCGFCTPCRVGGSLLSDLVDKAHRGDASDYDLQEMRNISALMKQSSHCGLGATASNHVADTLEKFPNIYYERLKASDFVPAFDLDAALQTARDLTGRDDRHAHLETDA